MKTTSETTPAAIREQLIALGFTLESSAPIGGVDEKQWPHLAYTVRLLYKGREVISTPYKLGVGHVKVPKRWEDQPPGLTANEKAVLNTLRNNPHANLKDKAEHAAFAVKLAKVQKVSPTLEDVMHSLCMDGEAFFNAPSFEDWAADFGYDADSRTAEQIFNACDAIGRKLARAIPADVLEQVREITSSL